MRKLVLILAPLLLFTLSTLSVEAKRNVLMKGNPTVKKFDQLPPEYQKKAIELCKRENCDPKKLTYYDFGGSSTTKTQMPGGEWECRWCCGIFCCFCDPKERAWR